MCLLNFTFHMDFMYKALLNYRLDEVITGSESATNGYLGRWHTVTCHMQLDYLMIQLYHISISYLYIEP